MGLVQEAKRIKEVHPDYIAMFKSGSFYKVFGKDAYILSELFDYQTKIIENNVATCGFPLNSAYKIRTKLEEKNINYMMLDPRNNYDVDVKEDFNNLNNYKKIFEKAYSNNKSKKKISHIAEELSLFIEKPEFKEIIRKIEDILDEAREV